MSPPSVQDNPSRHRFEIEIQGKLSWAEYTLGEGTITFTHTPSIAAMEEMNGTAHFLFGRALMGDAGQAAQSCAAWTRARDVLAAGYRYLGNVPRVDQADDVDAHLAKSAGLTAQPESSAP